MLVHTQNKDKALKTNRGTLAKTTQEVSQGTPSKNKVLEVSMDSLSKDKGVEVNKDAPNVKKVIGATKGTSSKDKVVEEMLSSPSKDKARKLTKGTSSNDKVGEAPKGSANKGTLSKDKEMGVLIKDKGPRRPST
jgi:hypothetical protein